MAESSSEVVMTEAAPVTPAVAETETAVAEPTVAATESVAEPAAPVQSTEVAKTVQQPAVEAPAVGTDATSLMSMNREQVAGGFRV